jgi:DNA polymerase-4
MRCVFHIDLDAFFVAVERVLDPSLVGKPVVVGGKPGSRGVVACASYEARKYGLRAGMSLTRAVRLCPHAVFLEGHFRDYQEVSGAFMSILERYSPFLEPVGIDEAYLDMTGFESLYGPLRNAAVSIKQDVRRELGVVASIGIASCKVAAKVASDFGKPDGLVEVPSGGEAEFLAPLPVQDIPGIGMRTARVLIQRLGVMTAGQLADVSPLVLRRNFGIVGDHLHLWANGQDASSVMYVPEDPKSISRETTFQQDVSERKMLLAALRYLAERVGAALRQEGKRARCVFAKVRYSDFQTIAHQSSLRMPVCHDDGIFEAGASLVLRMLREHPGSVRLVGIGVSDLLDDTPQLGLFDMPSERLERLSRTVDAVRGKYGFTAIQRGRTLPLHDLYPVDNRGYILKTSCLSR